MFLRIFLVVFFSFNLQGTNRVEQSIPEKLKNYYNLYNEALFNFSEQQYSKTIELANEAVAVWELNYDVVDLYIKTFMKMKRNSEAIKWMRYSIVHYNRTATEFASFYSDGTLAYGLKEKDPIIIALKREEDSLRMKFLTTDKKQYLRIFEEMYRCHSMINTKAKLSIIFDSTNINRVDQLYKNKQDSVIAKYCVLPSLKYIIDRTNYPDASEIGGMTFALSEIFIKYDFPNKIKIMDTALYLGKMSPDEYAYIYDRSIRVNYYGTKLVMLNNTMTLDKIPDVNKVDLRRANIGLAPIWKLSKYYKYKLSEEYLETISR